jgi:H+/Cl- antiporter ClcA
MNKTAWTVLAVIGIIVLLVFLAGASLLGGWGYGRWGMMGPGMMGGWGRAPFGWIGMIFMWLIPVGFVVLLVLGIIWLVRAISSPTGAHPAPRACSNCGRPAQPDWRVCPYCGKELP